MPLLHIYISSCRLTWHPGILASCRWARPRLDGGDSHDGAERIQALYTYLVWHVPLVALGSVWGSGSARQRPRLRGPGGLN